jgi:hypothetical protein
MNIIIKFVMNICIRGKNDMLVGMNKRSLPISKSIRSH